MSARKLQHVTSTLFPVLVALLPNVVLSRHVRFGDRRWIFIVGVLFLSRYYKDHPGHRVNSRQIAPSITVCGWL